MKGSDSGSRNGNARESGKESENGSESETGIGSEEGSTQCDFHSLTFFDF